MRAVLRPALDSVLKKLTRFVVLKPLFFLPKDERIRRERRLRGREQLKKLARADYVIVSFPQSGRTWLRTMLTRFYQARHGIDEMRLLGLKNLNKLDSAIPKVFFTHDHYIRDYTGRRDSKVDFAAKKIVLLVRDPRDTAVSLLPFAQVPPQPGAQGLQRHRGGRRERAAAIRVHALSRRLGGRLHELVAGRARRSGAPPAGALRGPARGPGGASAGGCSSSWAPCRPSAEIADAVAFAAFDNMKKLEESAAFGSDDRRIVPGEASNPESFKVRRGKVGGYRDHFSAEQAALIEQRVARELRTGLRLPGRPGPCPRRQRLSCKVAPACSGRLRTAI